MEKRKVDSNNQYLCKMFVTVYAHYPQAYNSTTISDKLSELINSYLKCKNNYVFISSSPHNEEEMITIEVVFDNKVEKTINDEEIKTKIKESVLFVFENKIKNINIDIQTNDVV